MWATLAKLAAPWFPRAAQAPRIEHIYAALGFELTRETQRRMARWLAADARDKFPGDPRRIADAVLMVSERKNPPLHLLLGHDVYEAYREKLLGLMASVEEWKDVTLDVNFPSKR